MKKLHSIQKLAMVARVLFSVLMVAFIAFIAGFGEASVPISIVVHIVVLAIAKYAPMPGNVMYNTITSAAVVKFAQDAEAKFRPSNEFYLYSQDDSSLISDSGNQVVHAVAGDDPDTVINPTSFPLAVQDIDDDVVSYMLDLIATKPQRIGDLEKAVRNYAYRQTIIDAHNQSLMVKIANKMIELWSPTEATRFVRTTGVNTPAALTGKGATGNRKGFTEADFIKAVKLLKDDDIDISRVYGLIDTGVEEQLYKLPRFVDYDKTGRADKLAQGIIGKFMNIEFMTRSTAARYSNAGTPAPLAATAATASTTNAGVLIWTPQAVRRAEGRMEVYLNSRLGTMLGDTYNVSKRYGGRRRKDGKGVVSIIEDAAA